MKPFKALSKPLQHAHYAQKHMDTETSTDQLKKLLQRLGSRESR